MADDATNDEILKSMEASEKEFKDAMVCEGVSVVDNSNQFIVEFKGGRICIIGPNKQTLTKTELCKLKDMMGFNYEQAIVTKREYRTDITHDKKNDKPLYTVQEIVAKHTDIWMDEYETDRSGLHEVICEKTLKVDNQQLDKTTEDRMDLNIYEYNLNISDQQYNDILKFYSENNNPGATNKGLKIIKCRDLSLVIDRPTKLFSKELLSTSGTTTVSLIVNSDTMTNNAVTVLYPNAMDFKAGTQNVVLGGAPGLPYLPK